MNKFQSSQTASRVLTYGGPPYRTNFSIKEWEEGLANELVAIDRSGDPLYYAITIATLPGLPEPTVYRLAKIVQRAVRLYYKENTVEGCTDASSPRFNFEANVDDGSCQAENTNFTFGGVYQKCYTTRYDSAGNLCEKLQQKNPLTGVFFFPRGVSASGSIKAPFRRNVRGDKGLSSGFLWLKRCCHTSRQNVFHYSMVHFQAFWYFFLRESQLFG